MPKQFLADQRTPYYISLPSNPVDGQEIRYAADQANGIFWDLRYSAQVGKWCCIGGSPLIAEVTVASSMTSSTYGDPSVGTSGPSITLPLAGVYEVTHGAFMYMSAAAVGYMSYAIGATAAVDADALIDGLISGSNVSRTRIKT